MIHQRNKIVYNSKGSTFRPLYLGALFAGRNAGEEVFHHGKFSAARSIRRDQQRGIAPDLTQSGTGCYGQQGTAVVQEGTSKTQKNQRNIPKVALRNNPILGSNLNGKSYYIPMVFVAKATSSSPSPLDVMLPCCSLFFAESEQMSTFFLLVYLPTM